VPLGGDGLTTSRALVACAPGRVVLRDVDVGDPAPGEIQVRVHASVVSAGTERAMVLHLPNTPGRFPFEPGYCAAGVVDRIGEGVTRYAVGDRVACYLLGHRERGNVDARWAVHVPPAVTFEHAAFMPLGQTCLQGVRKPRIELGESVLVLGLGIVGQLALQIARLNGGLPVIAAGRKRHRLDVAARCGADVTIDTDDPNWPAAAGEPPVVLDCTGSPDAIATALRVAARRGRVVLLGSTRGDSTINFYQDVHRKGVTVIGAHTLGANPDQESQPGAWSWHQEAQCFMRLLEHGRVDLDPIVGDVVHADRVVDAYQAMLRGCAPGIATIVRWNA
jgi:2-desacetyl-2-hydroxyethyl bacteriochlorophyllide A dehydrogenase